MKHLMIAALLLSACNTSTKSQQQDSTLVESVKQVIPVAPPPGNPNIDDQLNAQDTLFEDGSTPISWSNAGFEDPTHFKRFLLSFKDWVRNDQVDSIASHIRFPLKISKSPETFRKEYADIFDAELKMLVDTQRLDRVFRNYQGAMLGNGEIWFNVVDGKYRIIAINK